jgi:acyl-CoA synthetase
MPAGWWDPCRGQISDFRRVVDPDLARHYREQGWWADDTLADSLSRWAAEQPDAPAYVGPAGTLTWARLDRASDRVAAVLAGCGLEPGERVAVMMADGPTLHAAFLGAEKAGLTVVGIGARSGSREVERLVGRTGARVLVSGPALGAGGPAAGGVGASSGAGGSDARAGGSDAGAGGFAGLGLIHVVLPAMEAPGPAGAPILVDGRPVDPPPLDPAERRRRRLGPDDLFLVNSTSGTTGRPKCVTHTQNRWRYFHTRAVAHGGLGPADVFFAACPMPFGFGLWTSHVSPILLGATTVLAPRFSAAATLAAIEREKVTVLAAVSTQFILMLADPDLDRRDLSSLRVLFTGGESIPFARAVEWEERTGSKLLQFYGSNETGLLSGTTLDDPPEIRLRSAGRVVPEMQVRLYDGDRDVTSSGSGQAACRGPATSPGYLDDPEANRQLFTPDGWMLMADRCTLHGDVLTVTGRTTDIIIRGGKNISAAQVEEEAMTHPAVALAAAVAVPDPIFGERVCLYAQLHPGRTLTLDDLVGHLRRRGCGPDLLPERLVVIDELPVAVGGKVAKGELRRLVGGGSVPAG